jgi:LemA protein
MNGPSHWRVVPLKVAGRLRPAGELRGVLRIVMLICAVLSVSGCGYRLLQQQDEDVKASWSEVVNLYQRRADLISGLASSVKEFAASERELIGATQARAQFSSLPASPAVLNDPKAFARYQAVQSQLTASAQSLLGLSEAYPQLQSDANFRDLQAQLAATESNITAARNHYTAAVATFNAMVRTFPTDLTARMFDFHAKPAFAAATPAGAGKVAEK